MSPIGLPRLQDLLTWGEAGQQGDGGLSETALPAPFQPGLAELAFKVSQHRGKGHVIHQGVQHALHAALAELAFEVGQHGDGGL